VRFPVEAGHGLAVELAAGHAVQVIDVEGGQVGDLFAFSLADPSEHLSASHTRIHNGRMFPSIGQPFVTDRREPLLVLEVDESAGVHDMLIAACDRNRYVQLGVWPHRSSADNLNEALAARALVATVVPQPVNLFMSVEVGADGSIELAEATTARGDSVTLRAVRACIVVVSACPQYLLAVNRSGPSPLALEVSP